jgi:hypothetical protein
MGTSFTFKDKEAGRIDGIRSESYQVAPRRWTCISYLEHSQVQSLVTSQHPSREDAIARMTVLVAAHFDGESGRRN